MSSITFALAEVIPIYEMAQKCKATVWLFTCHFLEKRNNLHDFVK